MTMDVDGNGVEEYTVVPENPTNTFYFKESGALGIAPGTYTPQVMLQIDDNGSRYYRNLKAATYTVKAEEDYTFSASDVNSIIKAHKSQIAYILSQGVYTDMVQYPQEVWEAALDMYQDGINNPANMEANTYKVRDTDNRFEVKGIDNRVDTIHQLTEYHMSELRRILEGK